LNPEKGKRGGRQAGVQKRKKERGAFSGRIMEARWLVSFAPKKDVGRERKKKGGTQAAEYPRSA